MDKLNKFFRYIPTRISIRLHEHKCSDRAKYLLYRNHSDTLLIVFSAFGNLKPSYNYVRALSNSRYDRLCIMDVWGYKGSYYWYENGSSKPELDTLSIINQIVNGGGYKRVITIGTSKGGSAAIYFGLKIKANAVYSGANQYYVGNYLNTESNKKTFKSMMGEKADFNEQQVLNCKLAEMLKLNAGSQTEIHLLYSKQEHTYNEHIKYLIEDLKKYNIYFDEKVEEFTEHNDVGKFFIPYIQQNLL